MIKVLKKFNDKVDKMDQGDFNVWFSIIFTTVVLVPMFLIGIHRYVELYLK